MNPTDPRVAPGAGPERSPLETSEPGIPAPLADTPLLNTAGLPPAVTADADPPNASTLTRETVPLTGSGAPLPLPPMRPNLGVAENLENPNSLPRIGRYVVLRELERGGMGVTYVAYDEPLRREVVLKLVRPDTQQGVAAQQRLQREAQALAALSHPNIVTVYEVGWHQGHVFVAMELVQGPTLDAWQISTQRPWRDVVSLYRQAGDGLAAAHAAGLVHRDFKPANAIVGEDGRVRVLDFGIVRVGEAADRARLESSSGSYRPPDTDLRLTLTGDFLGTPAFASPEQLRGRETGPASDQFSFCISLYRALYGTRPFDGHNFEVLSANVLAGRLNKPPADAPVPAWVWPVVKRGLALNPADRWPSIETLLKALGQDPSQRLRRRFAGVALVVGVAALAVLGQRWLEQQQVQKICSGPESKLAEVWDTARRNQVRAAFVATGAPRAASVWQRTAGALDTYVDRWQIAYRDTCVASVRADARSGLLAEQMACLGERRRRLGALTRALRSVEASSLAHAIASARDLPPLERCADPAYLHARVKPPEDPNTRERVATLRDAVVRADELLRLGQYEVADRILNQNAPGVASVGYPPLQAEANRVRGTLRMRQGEYDEAEALQNQAFFAARESGHTEVAVQAATELAFVVGYKQGRSQEGFLWVRLAEAELEDANSPDQRALLTRNHGILLQQQGDRTGAVQRYQEAVALWTVARGADHPQVARARSSLTLGLIDLGRYQEAVEQQRLAIAGWEAALGPDDPRLPYLLQPLGLALMRLGSYRQAIAVFERNVALFAQALGEDHPDLVSHRASLAEALVRDGQSSAAFTLMAHTLRRARAQLGVSHQRTGDAQAVMGLILQRQGQPEAALVQYQQAWRILESAQGPALSRTAGAILGLVELLLAAGNTTEARLKAAAAVTFTETAGDALDRARAQFLWARAAEMPTARDQAVAAESLLAAVPGDRAAKLRREILGWLASIAE